LHIKNKLSQFLYHKIQTVNDAFLIFKISVIHTDLGFPYLNSAVLQGWRTQNKETPQARLPAGRNVIINGFWK